jgi:hypothetical protein
MEEYASEPNRRAPEPTKKPAARKKAAPEAPPSKPAPPRPAIVTRLRILYRKLIM